MGLSPCVWGHRMSPLRSGRLTGSIPMFMGPPNSTGTGNYCTGVYPHVYGATRWNQNHFKIGEGLSPCVWGHPMKALRQQVLRGSIPMCMGPPTWNAIAPGIGWVYPHVYGATHAVRCGLLWFRSEERRVGNES